jgi:putative endonuclease
MARRAEVGKLGESVAARYLIAKGYAIVAQNYRVPVGEIDIIALKGSKTHFVEVKTVTREKVGKNMGRFIDVSREKGSDRGNSGYNPMENISPQKMRRVARAASIYIQWKKVRDWQSDVVSVVLDRDTKKAHCELIENVLLEL